MAEIDVGDVVKITGLSEVTHSIPVGNLAHVVEHVHDDIYKLENLENSSNGQLVHFCDFKKVNAGEGMSTKQSKNFRNGDVIKVRSRHVTTSDGGTQVFVKFGENYYNLSAGGQMKAYKYLPSGDKDVILNLSGMGGYFLMDEGQLEKELTINGTTKEKEAESVVSPANPWQELIREYDAVFNTGKFGGSSY